VLAKGMRLGHIDGIGTYTSELLKAYGQVAGGDRFEPVVFGRELLPLMPGAHALPLPYNAAVLLAAATGAAFPGAGALGKRIDLFHATDHHVPRLNATPVVATIMDVIGVRHPEWVTPRLRGIKNRLFAKASEWAQQIITISDFSAMDIAECWGIDPRRIVSIPLGVDQAYFDTVENDQRQSVLQRYGLRSGYFIFVGTLQPRKNVERILAAHAALPPAYRRAHPLVIAGQQGWSSETLRQGLADLEASGFGRWLNYVPRADIFALLQSAQALVFPSLYEGFGLPVLEGFASRIPVITSNTTSLPEVAGDAALMVDPESVEQIAEAMRRCIDGVSERPALVERGLEQAKRFTWQATAERTLAVYHSMLP
jgi:alpha-1,3-rhamnosyl/mannosyltransferase